MRGAEKNWTAEGVRFYTAVLPTELPTELKIIFFRAVALNSVGNFCRYFLNFALKFWKSLQIFRSPLAHPYVKWCQSTRTLDLPRPSGNASVIMAGAVIFLQLSAKYRRVIFHQWLWQNAVIVFATLCKIPMGQNPSV